MSETNQSTKTNTGSDSQTVQPTSPAHDRTPLTDTTSLCELPWYGKINLRGDPNDPQFLSLIQQHAGIALPLKANTTASGEGVVAFNLGPDEWLLHCKIADTEKLIDKLQSNLSALHYAATEVTDYFTVLELSGEHAAAALARGCPLDLHEQSFQATQCAQTRFGNASVLLYKPDASPLFNIQVRWSFTEYVWDYLESAIQSLQDTEE